MAGRALLATSNVVVIGQRAYGRIGGVSYSGAIWIGKWEHARHASTIRGIRNTDDDSLFGTNSFAYSSQHPGGVHFVLGDGSVRFIPANADRIVMAMAAGRDSRSHWSADYRVPYTVP